MIRKATQVDWDALSIISARAGYDDYINSEYGSSFLDTGTVYVSENSNIDGFIKIEPLEDMALWFSGLRVSSESWRKHIGTALLQYIYKYAGENSFNSLRCMVETTNIPSIKLMQSFGMSVKEKFNFFLGGIDLSEYKFIKFKPENFVNKQWKFDKKCDGIYINGENRVYIYRGRMDYYTILNGSDFKYTKDGTTCIPESLSIHLNLQPDQGFPSGYIFEKGIKKH
ncbi:GNAT family N-acetyltransferase [Ferroplasma sp.]|uniref:GNAT family N-acetyltransferase n=1 Tax=Ferroplasma sp. TaxID=2591003 RepID=UPI00307DFBEA